MRIYPPGSATAQSDPVRVSEMVANQAERIRISGSHVRAALLATWHRLAGIHEVLRRAPSTRP